MGKAKSRMFFAAVAVFALTLAASCGGASGGGGQQSTGGGAQEDTPAKKEQALGSESLGDADAPVVLTEYADYQ